MNEESKQERLGTFPFVISALSFIPLIGMLFGFVAISWGLATKKLGGKKLAVIGLIGLAFSIIIIIGNLIGSFKKASEFKIKDIEISKLSSEGNNKVAKIDNLLELTHISVYDEARKESFRQYQMNSSITIYNQIKLKYPNLLANKKDEVDKIVEQFWKDLSNSLYQLESFHDNYRRMYFDKFNEKELDEMIAYYSSSIGRKDVMEKKIAAFEYSQRYDKEYNSMFNNEMNTMWKKLDKLN